jgi:protein-S-isoprenylcysteine O-methyltransferase Ste14
MNHRTSSRGPGILCPPPLIFLGGLLLAAGLDRWLLELAVDPGGRGRWQSDAGWSLVTLGFALMAWGLVTLVRHRTTFHPDRDASRLVVAGPYRHSRNPIYLGLTGVYAGAALLANTLWAILLLPLVLIIVRTQVVGREERYLARTFGEDYSEYCRRVRRWF